MYGKVFESIFDSTLAADGGWMPTYIFMSMIVLADQDGIVDVAPKALYRRLGFGDCDSKILYNDFAAAIEYLQQPDSSSRSAESAGRRIIPMSEVDYPEGNRGFLIVNYEYYRNKGSREDRARQSTERTRRWREKHKKNNDGTQGDAKKRLGRHTDTDTSHFPSESAQEADHVIWNTGIELLGNHKSDRSLLGKWVKEFGKEKVAAAIAQAAVHRPVEPKAYITAALQERVQPTDPYYKQLGQAVAKC